MEPAMKKKVLSDKAIWYKSLDLVEKEKLLSHIAQWYKSLDPKGKEKLQSKSADWYKSFGSAETQNLLSSRAIWYKSLDTAQEQKRAEWFNSLNSALKQKRAEQYKSLNPEEKEKLLSGRAVWYKTLDPADKDKIISQVQANKEAIETQFNVIQYTRQTPVVSLHLILRIQYRPGIPVTPLTVSSLVSNTGFLKVKCSVKFSPIVAHKNLQVISHDKQETNCSRQVFYE